MEKDHTEASCPGFRDTFVRESRRERVMRYEKCGQLPVLKFPDLEACGKVRHFFTTRAGGVSEGQFSTLNFSISLGDSPENVLENYRRVSAALGCRPEEIVGTVQTHTTNIRRVELSDAGKGITRRTDYGDVDGLVTDQKGLVLAAYAADCVPLFFVDPVKEAVGLAHSGWRGTAGNMAGRMVERMHMEFGSDPADLLVGIGPSICRECYEVDEDTAGHFADLTEDSFEPGRKVLVPGKKPGKYQLDLWGANYIRLIRAGVLPEKIEVTDICTAHNSEQLFSHRASSGKRGNLGAFLGLL